MLIVIAKNKLQAEKRDEYLQALVEAHVIEDTRAENGNLGYDFCAPADNPKSVLIIERWEDVNLMREHMASKNYATVCEINQKFGVNQAGFDIFKAEKLN